MRIKKWVLLVNITILCLSISVGCWNYREVDKMAVVGGVAIDKGTDGKYLLTVETFKVPGGIEGDMKPQIFTITGKTVFDAVRNVISLSGKRLYWSHTKVVILSQDIASEGILSILDWFRRDSETRDDTNILVSKESTAQEILLSKNNNEIKSLILEDILKNQVSLNKAPIIEIWEVINDILTPGVVAILPVVALKNGKVKVMETAIFNKDKLIGFLNGEESMYLLFVKDQIKGGLLVLDQEVNNKHSKFSLEIFRSKTKVKPIFIGDRLEMNIHVNTTVAVDEVEGEENYSDEKYLKELKANAEKELNSRIKEVISQVQNDYGVDVFGFGAIIREENPKRWKKLQPIWEEKYQNLYVNVTSNIKIKGSAMLAEPLEMGD